MPISFQCRFGWGGHDTSGRLRGFPQPKTYQFKLNRCNTQVQPSTELQLDPALFQKIYNAVFRPNLKGPGFAVISGFESLVGNNIQMMRAFQVSLAQQFAKLRQSASTFSDHEHFTVKYMGQSNKTKLNPIHCDTKATDSMVLMLYEPSKNIVAYPFIADLSQYAQDTDVPAEDMLSVNPNLKAHYGKQLTVEHHEPLLADYALDLPELSSPEVKLVILNDSLGPHRLGNVHGVRNLEITGPEPQRPFHHVVVDVEAQSPGFQDDTTLQPQTSMLYMEKKPLDGVKIPVSFSTAVERYIREGRIHYRQNSDR
jgi:hypothetical protein